MAADPPFVSCAKLAREATTVNLCVRATTQEFADRIADQVPESIRVDSATGTPQSLGPSDAGSCNEAQTVCAYVTGESRTARERALKEVLEIAATTMAAETETVTPTASEPVLATVTQDATAIALQNMKVMIEKIAQEARANNAAEKRRTEAERRRAEKAEEDKKKAEADAAIAQGVANTKAIENDDLKASNTKKDRELGEATLAIQALGAQNQRLEKILIGQAVGVGLLILLGGATAFFAKKSRQKQMDWAIANIEEKMVHFLDTIQELATNGSVESNNIREDIERLLPRLHGMVAAQLSPLTLALEEVRKRLVEVESNTAPLSLPPLPPLAVAEAKDDPDLEEEGLPYLAEPPQGGSNGNGKHEDLDGTLDLRNVATLVGGA
jgi:hypothetical protein